MSQKMTAFLARGGVAVAALAVSASSFAVDDAAGAATQITAVGGDVSTIGWAVLGVLVVAAGFKFMRRAI